MFLIILAWIGNWQISSPIGRPYYEPHDLINGAWSTEHKPISFRHNNNTFIGFVDKSGNVGIINYNNIFKTHTSFILHATLEVDLHDNPSLLLRDDNKLIAFYCKHNGDTLRYRISSNPLSISAWGVEQKVYIGNTITYPNPIKLDGENKIYVFFRGHADIEEWSYITSTDSGQTWSSINTFFREPFGNHDYMKIVSDGDSIIHFIHYGHAVFENSDLFYFRYKNDSLYRIDGTVVGSLAGDTIFRSEMDTIYKQGDPGHYEVFRGNIAIDSLQNPYVAFTTYTDSAHCIFNYGYWNGSSWTTDTITSADSLLGNYFVGSIDIDKQYLNRVYFFKFDIASSYYHIYRASTNDGGNNWNIYNVTWETSDNNIVPMYIDNCEQHVIITWMKGDFTTYINYDTDIMVHKETFK